MITNVILGPSQTQLLRELDQIELAKSVGKSYPYPVAISYTNLQDALRSKDFTLAMLTFTNDITTSILQYLALVLASDYIQTDGPRTLRIFRVIENMTYRPGPGKWLEFLREIYLYHQIHPEVAKNHPELLEFIDKHEIGKKSKLLTLEENDGESPCKKAGLLEFMVAFRNSIAHSKGYDEAHQKNLVSAIAGITDYLYAEIRFLACYKLFYQGEESISFSGDKLPNLDDLPMDSTMKLKNGDLTQELYPLIINEQYKKSRDYDIFLLESLDNSRAFYSGNRIISQKQKGKDALVDKVHSLLKSIEVEPKVLNSDEVTWAQLRRRCVIDSEHIVAEYILNGKFREDVYVASEAQTEIVKEFGRSGKKVAFLSDDQGAGKSAFCAYQAYSFLQNGDGNQALLLIDARQLDEHGKTPMLIEKHISAKLGITGYIPGMLKRISEKNTDLSFTIFIDNLNEYFLKGTHQAFVLDQLFDFIMKISDVQAVRIIALSRPEYFRKGFDLYRQSYLDKNIEAFSYLTEEKDIHKLPALNDYEIEKIWNNYSGKLTGHCPKTLWSDLAEDLQQHCRRPLIMLFLLRNYDNRPIPSSLSLKEIKRQYVKTILANREVQDTLFMLVRKMHKENSAALFTETFSDTDIRKIADTSKSPGTNLPYNYAYNWLIESQILREEKVSRNGLIGKKITANNELTLEVINTEYKKWGLRSHLRIFSLMWSLGIFLIGLTIIYAALKLSNSVSANIHPLSQWFASSAGISQLNIDNDILTPLVSIISGNYHTNLHIKTMIFSGFWMGYFTYTLLFLLFALSKVLEYYRKVPKKAQGFSFFELQYFQEIAKTESRKIINQVLFLGLFVILILMGLMLMNLDPNFNLSFIILFVFIFLVVSIYVRRLYSIINKVPGYIHFYRYSSNTLGLFIPFIAFIIVLFSMYFSAGMIDNQHYLKERYTARFNEKINEITRADRSENIKEVIGFLENSPYRDIEPFSRIIIDIENGLKQGEIKGLSPLLSDFPTDSYFKEMVTELYDELGIKVILLLGVLLSTATLAAYLPIWLFHRKMNLAEPTRII